ncbi:MAG: hypothetical protein QOE41_1300 [Mycobacterium sp.]|jgi:hypothetical protein|nr:hypothetical protein [Mycobacterium sp.]
MSIGPYSSPEASAGKLGMSCQHGRARRDDVLERRTAQRDSDKPMWTVVATPGFHGAGIPDGFDN